MARKPDFPPHPLGRLVASRRYSALRDLLPTDIHPEVKFFLNDLGRNFMSRADLADVANLIAELERPGIRKPTSEVSAEDITALERNGDFSADDKIYWILRATLMPHTDVMAILENIGTYGSISATTLKNVHLVDGRVALKYAQSEFGPLMNAAIPIHGIRTTWVDVVAAGPGGFKEDELRVKLMPQPKCIRPSDLDFQTTAKNIARRWKETNSSNSDNPTLAIKRISINMKPDIDERAILNIDFVGSSYRYNSVAKGGDGAKFRWRQLQEQEDPKDALTHLSSGIGVAVNAVCMRDNKLILGQRLKVNFRRNEFDVAVVEGIRPTADVRRDGSIDLFGAVRRALDEEVGLKHALVALNRDPSELVSDVKIIGFGVDLRYYQYNFLCNVNLDVSFDDVEKIWSHAKDRNENRRLHGIKNTLASTATFVKENNIWSSGMAAMVKSFDYC